MLPICSSATIRKLQQAIAQKKESAEVSLDLGLSTTTVLVSSQGVVWEGKGIALPHLREKDKSCYLLRDGKLEKMQYFSAETNLVYKLIPTSGRPLLQISGTSMHKQQFIERIEKEKLQGNILDAGTGLGYTAITAAKTAKHVTTIEHDPTVIELQKLNPWSQELFTRKNITCLEGDAPQLIKNFDKESFDTIIYDAGTPKSSGNFFSTENYAETYRVLKRNGKLYHYIPRPQVKQGRDFAQEVIKRLEELKFNLLERNEKDCYIIAQKP